MRLKVSFPFMVLMNRLKDQWFRMLPSLIGQRAASFLAYFGMTLGGLEEMDLTGGAFLGGAFLVGEQAPLPCVLYLPLPGFCWCFHLPPCLLLCGPCLGSFLSITIVYPPRYWCCMGVVCVSLIDGSGRNRLL